MPHLFIINPFILGYSLQDLRARAHADNLYRTT